MLLKEKLMKYVKLSDLATVQSGLVLNRKEAKDDGDIVEVYHRLNLRSLGEDGRLKLSELDVFNSQEHLDSSLLTKSGDVAVRLFVPICPITIGVDEINFVVPSQLATVRIENRNDIVPEYLRWYLSQEYVTENILAKEGWQSQRTIKISTIADLIIPVPEIEKQDLIVRINKMSLMRERLYKELVRQEKLLTNAMINNAIGGKVK